MYYEYLIGFTAWPPGWCSMATTLLLGECVICVYIFILHTHFVNSSNRYIRSMPFYDIRISAKLQLEFFYECIAEYYDIYKGL